MASSHDARIHNISLFVGEQDHRHGLRTDRLDHRVRRCDEKTISMVKYLVERGFTVFMISYSVHAELCTYPTGSGDCEESGEIDGGRRGYSSGFCRMMTLVPTGMRS